MQWVDLSALDARLIVAEDLFQDPFLAVVSTRPHRRLRAILERAGFARLQYGDYGLILRPADPDQIAQGVIRLAEAAGDAATWIELGEPDIYPQRAQQWQNGTVPPSLRRFYAALHDALVASPRPDGGRPDGIQGSAEGLAGGGPSGDRPGLPGAAGGGAQGDLPAIAEEPVDGRGPGGAPAVDIGLESDAGGAGAESADGDPGHGRLTELAPDERIELQPEDASNLDVVDLEFHLGEDQPQDAGLIILGERAGREALERAARQQPAPPAEASAAADGLIPSDPSAAPAAEFEAVQATRVTAAPADVPVPAAPAPRLSAAPESTQSAAIDDEAATAPEALASDIVDDDAVPAALPEDANAAAAHQPDSPAQAATTDASQRQDDDTVLAAPEPEVSSGETALAAPPASPQAQAPIGEGTEGEVANAAADVEEATLRAAAVDAGLGENASAQTEPSPPAQVTEQDTAAPDAKADQLLTGEDARSARMRASTARHAEREALRAAPPSAVLAGIDRPITVDDRREALLEAAPLLQALAVERAACDMRGELFAPPLTDDERRKLAGMNGTYVMPQGSIPQLRELQPLATLFLNAARAWNLDASNEAQRDELSAMGIHGGDTLGVNDVAMLLERAELLQTSQVTPGFARTLWSVAQRLGFSGGEVLLPNSGTGELSVHKPLGARVTQVPNHPIAFEAARALHPEDVVINAPFTGVVLPARHYDLAIAVSHASPDRANAIGGRAFVLDEAIATEPDTPPLTEVAHLLYKTSQRLKDGGVAVFALRKSAFDPRQDWAVHVARHVEFVFWTPLSSQLIGGHVQPIEASGARRVDGQRLVSDLTSLMIVVRRREVPIGADEAARHLEAIFPDYPSITATALGSLDAARAVRQRFANEGHRHETAPRFREIYEAGLKEETERILAAVPQALIQPPEHRIESLPVIAQLPTQHATELEDVDGIYCANDRGALCYREGGTLTPVELPARATAIVMAMARLRDGVRRALAVQLNSADDDALRAIQRDMRRQYDDFVERYGPLTHPDNMQLFSRDAFAASMMQLEIYDPEREAAEPTRFFSERVVRRMQAVERAETPEEAIGISMGRKACIDPNLMSVLLQRPWDEIRREQVGNIFLDPIDGRWITRSQYLSGPVRAKLSSALIAEEIAPNLYQGNVQALIDVQPAVVPPEKIDFMIGAPWIPMSDYARFIAMSLGATGANIDRAVKVRYLPSSASFKVDLLQPAAFNAGRRADYSIGDLLDAGDLFEGTLNGRSIRITVPDPTWEGPERERPKIVDHVETSRAHMLQERVKEEFQAWALSDDRRAERLGRIFNERVNAYVDREVDGSYLRFERCSPLFTPMSQQRDGVARFLEDGNLLIAHALGTGKTFTQAACALEATRMGLFSKPMMVTPNATFSQTAAQIIQAYPTAKVLLAPTLSPQRKDQIADFVARAAMQNWDVILMTYESFKAIPLSPSAQATVIRRQMAELLREQRVFGQAGDALGRRYSMLNKRLRRLTADAQQGSQANGFERMGVDLLIVDEAQNFKNLDVSTKKNILGITSGGSERARDLQMKIEHIRAFNGAARGVVMATATPICNSIAEVYTMMNYINPNVLRAMNIRHFDAWAATFGRSQALIEQKPAGDGFQLRERFIRFQNVPELVRSFKMIADLKLDDDQIDAARPRPTMATDLSSLERDRFEEAYLKTLEVRARHLESGPTLWLKDSVIVIMGDLRRGMLDLRLIDPRVEAGPGSVVEAVSERVADIWARERDGRGTQLIFCDSGVGATGFSLYDDLRERLVARGIPRNEIALITEYPKLPQRHRLFQKINKGTVRVLIGSSQKIGVGVNVQERVVAMHHMDMPMRPDMLAQRIGRGQRPGNRNRHVENHVYAKQGQTRAFEILQNKFAAIQQAFRNPDKAARRLDEELDITMENIQVELTDNNMLREKVSLDNEVKNLMLAQTAHQRSQARLQVECDDLATEIGAIEAGRDRYIAGMDVAKRLLAGIGEHAQRCESELLELRGRIQDMADRTAEIGRRLREIREEAINAAVESARAQVPAEATQEEAGKEADASADVAQTVSLAELSGADRAAAVRRMKNEYHRQIDMIYGTRGHQGEDKGADIESIQSILSDEQRAEIAQLMEELNKLTPELTAARARRDRLDAGDAAMFSDVLVDCRVDPNDPKNRRQITRPSELGELMATCASRLRGVQGAHYFGEICGAPVRLRYVPFVLTDRGGRRFDLVMGSGQTERPSDDTIALGLENRDVEPLGYADVQIGDVVISSPITLVSTSNALRVRTLFKRFCDAVEERLGALDSMRRNLDDLRSRLNRPFDQEDRLREAIERKSRLDRDLLLAAGDMSQEREAEVMEPVLAMEHATTGRPVHPEVLRTWVPPQAAERVDDAPLEAQAEEGAEPRVQDEGPEAEVPPLPPPAHGDPAAELRA